MSRILSYGASSFELKERNSNRSGFVGRLGNRFVESSGVKCHVGVVRLFVFIFSVAAAGFFFFLRLF